jgi:CubicO group peptidase (beta-lactamase class C family)
MPRPAHRTGGAAGARPALALAAAALPTLALVAVACVGPAEGRAAREGAAGAPASAAAAAPAAAPRAAPGAAPAAAPARRAGAPDSAALADAFARAARLPKLRSLVVLWRDTVVAERYYHGARADAPANLKSASKSVVSALVGSPSPTGVCPGSTRRSARCWRPADARGLDSARRRITVADLLSMRAGLESTSIRNYGAWVSSRDWVRYALARPLVAPPGRPAGR